MLGPVELVEEIDSTNRALLERARAGAPHGIVLVADHQTAGRGRLDRTWEAPPGTSLLVSVLLRTDLGPDDRPLLTAAAGLSALDAAQEVAGVTAALKWPNDVVVEDRKLAGILAEVSGDAVVVGMGLNLHWPDPLPAHLGATATTLAAAAGRPVDRAPVLAAWLAAFDRRLALLDTVAGRATVRDEHIARCATIGRRVRVELAGGSFEGLAVTVAADGSLVVDDGDRHHTVAVADVVHLRPAG